MTSNQDLKTERQPTTTTWVTDPAHSDVTFSIRHMMIAKVRGSFREFNASLRLDEQDPEHSFVEAEIQAASIDTRTSDRDAHLRSPDFLDAGAHPVLHFKSTKIEKTGKDTARVTGDLTIRGTTKPVTLQVTHLGTGGDPWGNTRSAYTAEVVIDRKEWGLQWNQALETGGVLVGDKVKIEIEAQLVRQVVQA